MLTLTKNLLVLGIAILVGIGRIVSVNYPMLVFLKRVAFLGISPDDTRESLRRLNRMLPKNDMYRYVILAIPGTRIHYALG